MLWNLSDYIGTGILEVFECPESVADWSNGLGWVLEGKKQGLTRLTPKFLKSAILQKVS